MTKINFRPISSQPHLNHLTALADRLLIAKAPFDVAQALLETEVTRE